MSEETISRRFFLKTAGAGLALCGGTACASPRGMMTKKRDAPRKPPNILMILVDDLGCGDLSCCGAKDLKSPSIDSLMSAGMGFDRFYANCPVCSPTRASLLTGRYPDMAGVPGVIRTHDLDSWGRLSDRVTMLPDVLKKRGYHTAIVGKWHLGLEEPDGPNARGFQHFHGFLGDMMDDYYHHKRHGRNYMRLNEAVIKPEGHATDLFSRWAVDYLNARKGESQPFFLYLAYNAPHTPIQPPKDWVARVKQREPGISDRRARLVALIEHMDHGIGQVMKALQDNGQAENTLVVFSSDNGGQVSVEAGNGGLHGGKQDMWEGGIRVPFCAVWPGRIPAGRRNRDCVAITMDIYPTFCEAAGARPPEDIDGRSFLPLLLGKDMPWPDRDLIWVRREGGRYGGRAYYAIRHGPWKLLQNTSFEPMQLFNLEDDPLEQKPLPATHPKARRLFNALKNHIARSGAVPWK